MTLSPGSGNPADSVHSTMANETSVVSVDSSVIE